MNNDGDHDPAMDVVDDAAVDCGREGHHHHYHHPNHQYFGTVQPTSSSLSSTAAAGSDKTTEQQATMSTSTTIATPPNPGQISSANIPGGATATASAGTTAATASVGTTASAKTTTATTTTTTTTRPPRSYKSLSNPNHTTTANNNATMTTTPTPTAVPTATKWVTREIAALEFLLGIPLEAERTIVHEGYRKQQLRQQQQHHHHHRHRHHHSSAAPPTFGTATAETSASDTAGGEVVVAEPTMSAHHRQGRWWEKWIPMTTPLSQQQSRLDSAAGGVSRDSHIEDLEGPADAADVDAAVAQQEPKEQQQQPQQQQQQQVVPSTQAPGRRLEGHQATRVQIPLTAGTSVQTRQRSIARMAVTREWELQVAHGLAVTTGEQQQHRRNNNNNENRQQPSIHRLPLLDGRLYMSANESYPIQVFSLLRYEPRKEEAARRRQKLEARGGGGTQFFIMPGRDWRGISYRALLPGPNNTTTTIDDDAIPTPGSSSAKKSSSRTSSSWQHDRFVTIQPDRSFDSNSNNTDPTGKFSTPKNGIDDDTTDDDDDDQSTDKEDGGDTYAVGLLDDPEMTQGRHRNVMIGDRGTGPFVSSTIQFVKPQLLKADLNQQFRDRFDGWEPPKSQHKFIGAKVVDGLYTLMEPTFDKTGAGNDNSTVGGDEDTVATTPTIGTSNSGGRSHRKQASISSFSTIGGGTAGEKETIRMPPSLTLSKIRSIKAQALNAAVKARLEISTVALAIIYFERLCLDCRVDKSNRRLSFAACLLLAIKINEAHVGVVITAVEKGGSTSTRTGHANRIQSLVRPNKKSNTMFASLLEFFTQEWNLSLKHLFAAEWGVFAALQFRLQAKPSHVTFHFKRLMKTLGWDQRRYLGSQMYLYWQQALADEELQRVECKERIEARRQRKEEKKLLQLQRELEAANRRGKSSRSSLDDDAKEAHEVGQDTRKQITFVTLNDHDKEDADMREQEKGMRGKSQERTGRQRRRQYGPSLRSRSGGEPWSGRGSPRQVTRRRGSHRAGGLGDILSHMLIGGAGSDHAGQVRASRSRSIERSWGKRVTQRQKKAMTAPSSPVTGVGTASATAEITSQSKSNDQEEAAGPSIQKSSSMSALASLNNLAPDGKALMSPIKSPSGDGGAPKQANEEE